MAFELWSGASSNLLSVHKTEAEALAAVLQLTAANDAEYAAGLGLLHDNGRASKLIAQGAELVERARRAGHGRRVCSGMLTP
jgi:hypothetical protein